MSRAPPVLVAVVPGKITSKLQNLRASKWSMFLQTTQEIRQDELTFKKSLRQTDQQTDAPLVQTQRLYIVKITNDCFHPQIYHTECFRCFSCDKKLSSGEQYGVASGKVYCKTDYDSLPQELINSPSGIPRRGLKNVHFHQPQKFHI